MAYLALLFFDLLPCWTYIVFSRMYGRFRQLELYTCCIFAFRTWYGKYKGKERGHQKEGKTSSFWVTVLKVELADIAFAIDSMLAAVALAITLPPVGDFTIGGINGGQFLIMFLGGLIGLIIMRFAANAFVKLLHTRPVSETAAFLIVGWVGVKLAVFTLAHPDVGILDRHFPESQSGK